MYWEDKYFQALILSLLIHGLLYWGLSWGTPLFLSEAIKSPQPVEIVYKEEPEKNFNAQRITDPEVGQTLEKLQAETRLLARLNRRVEEEMVANKSGLTKNRAPNPTYSQIGPSERKEFSADNPNRTSPLDLNPESILKKHVAGLSVPNPSLDGGQFLSKQLMSGESTISDHLPNVKQGWLTALNTNQLMFYSFFSRVNEQIYPRWAQNLRLYVPDIPLNQIRRFSGQNLVTHVQFVFDRNGYYVSHHVYRSSGQRLVDLAAVEAFVRAAPFPNPPQEIVEPDGKIRLNYSFTLILQPSFLATK